MMKRVAIFFSIFIPLITFANTPLPAHKAFKIQVQKLDPNTIKVQWKIAKNYFLYKNCLQIINKDEEFIQLGIINYPTSQFKTNRQGQSFPVYHDKLELNVPIISDKPGESIIEVRFQGCSDEGFCYPPEKRLVKIAFAPSLSIDNAILENDIGENKSKSSTKAISSNVSYFTELFASKNTPLIIFTFLGLGILLAFTPCILPMIPVLSGVIVGHGPTITSRKAFLISLTYVLSMSVTYGIIGAVIALLGNNLQIIMQSPWVIVIFSIIFILLALSMFDFYAITLPLSLQNKMANITKRHSGSHYLNAALLGSMSILVLSPCVSAPLLGALSYIAQTGDIILGLLSLFFLSFGMGIPLLLIGTSAGKLLPRAGSWMNTVKHLFGILLLGLAIYLLSRILPDFYTMLLWASLCIFSGVFFKPFSAALNKKDRFRQGFAILLISYGLLILYGASSGNTDPIKPLQNNIPNSAKSKQENVRTLPKLQRLMNLAKEQNKAVVLYFYADWCASCKVIANTVLQDDAIRSELDKVSFIKVDITKNNQESKKLLNYFHVIAPPTFVFIDTKGNILPSPQLVGEISAEELHEELKNINYIGG